MAATGTFVVTTPSITTVFTGVEFAPHGTFAIRLPSITAQFGPPLAKRTYAGPGSGSSIAALKSV